MWQHEDNWTRRTSNKSLQAVETVKIVRYTIRWRDEASAAVLCPDTCG
ncbi:5804_t:CDS:2 [Acaulospora colombiana]|uniref:5804_t:CDS:1 n=1 Tax=Acaulospora colombiana TaxID=27376 RepID=A0ACA9PMS5_9GLOM|nr:5804_t:CDS:2 [Acaulospora colombiana]